MKKWEENFDFIMQKYENSFDTPLHSLFKNMESEICKNLHTYKSCEIKNLRITVI